MAPKEDIRCSFCSKHKDEVRKLIAGRPDVFICNECVDLCHDILDEEMADRDAGKRKEGATEDRRVLAVLVEKVEFPHPDDWQSEDKLYEAKEDTRLVVDGFGNRYRFKGDVLAGSKVDLSGEVAHLDLRVPVKQ